jgi:hypothetical protein
MLHICVQGIRAIATGALIGIALYTIYTWLAAHVSHPIHTYCLTTIPHYSHSIMLFSTLER